MSAIIFIVETLLSLALSSLGPALRPVLVTGRRVAAAPEVAADLAAWVLEQGGHYCIERHGMCGSRELDEATQLGARIKIEQFDCAVFDGQYVTGDVDEAYLNKIEQARNDASKVKTQAVSAIIDLYNN